MISRDQLIEIGNINKPHGIAGEMSATFICGIDDLQELSCIILDIEGIFVPFYIETIRPKNSDTALIKIDGVENEIQVKDFANKKIFALKDEVEEIESDENDAYYFIGFSILDKKAGKIGIIENVDDSTENYLFEVKTEDNQDVLIPITTDFIEQIGRAHV